MAYNSIQERIDEERRRFEERSNPKQQTARTFPLEEEARITEEDIDFSMPREFDTKSAVDTLLEDLMSEREPEQVEPESELSSAVQYAVPVVASWESFEPKAYAATKDERERGIYTVGYGQTEGVTQDTRVTQEEATQYLQEQLKRTEERLAEEVGPQWDSLTPAQKGAVISLAYNTDKDVVGQLKKSKALEGLKEGDLDKFLVEAFDEKRGFVRQSGKVLRGLQRRRDAEKRLFLYGDNQDFSINDVMNA